MAKIFYTPPGYSGSAVLTASTGLTIVNQSRWRFSQAGYNDGATFGLSLSWPDKTVNGQYDYGPPGQKIKPLSGGLLEVEAQDWTIPVIGNQLTSYTDPDTSQTYPASQCRILITGQWKVNRLPNSNSYNSFGVSWVGITETDLGTREMDPYLLNYYSPSASYVIQGANVTGGAENTFSDHKFYCRVTESATSDNSNHEFQSNTITSPVWAFTYSKSWEIDG